jgi:hypothetical protein
MRGNLMRRALLVADPFEQPCRETSDFDGPAIIE